MLRLVHSARELSTSAAPTPLVELSGGPGTARLSFAVSLLRRAQLEGETTAWIQKEDGALYPPDLEAAGVDLEALAVVRIPDSGGPEAPFRAAEMLLRSGAFGLLVVDARGGPARVHPSVQGRLLGAAREHRSRVLFLTDKTDSAESIGSLVSLRVEPRRVRVGPGTFILETRVLKNKHGLPLDDPLEHRRGPWGVR